MEGKCWKPSFQIHLASVLTVPMICLIFGLMKAYIAIELANLKGACDGTMNFA